MRQLVCWEHDPSELIPGIGSTQAAAVVLFSSSHFDEVSERVAKDEVLIPAIHDKDGCVVLGT